MVADYATVTQVQGENTAILCRFEVEAHVDGRVTKAATGGIEDWLSRGCSQCATELLGACVESRWNYSKDPTTGSKNCRNSNDAVC
jgi:hypothetical protein